MPKNKKECTLALKNEICYFCERDTWLVGVDWWLEKIVCQFCTNVMNTERRNYRPITDKTRSKKFETIPYMKQEQILLGKIKLLQHQLQITMRKAGFIGLRGVRQ